MAWAVEFTPAAERELGKLDRQAAVRIVQYLQDTVSTCNDPRLPSGGVSLPAMTDSSYTTASLLR